jgi:methionine-rich copper-binding protein CopC
MRRLLTAAVVGWIMAVVMPGAPAQAALAGSSPEPGAKVAPGTNVIALRFDDLAAGSGGRITVTGAVTILTGRPVAAGDTTLCAAVQPLTNGVYTVLYNATSTAGTPIAGKYTFTVADDGVSTGIPQPCNQVDLPSAFPVNGGYAAIQVREISPVVIMAAVAVLASVLFGLWRFYRPRPSPVPNRDS